MRKVSAEHKLMMARKHRRNYYLKHKERLKPIRKAWAQANPERLALHKAAFKLRHPEKSAIYAARAYAKPTTRDYRKKWDSANRHKRCLYARRYRKKHPDKVVQFNSARRLRVGPEDVYRNTIARFIRGLSKAKRKVCAYCGCAVTKVHIDHVVPIAKGGKHEIGNLAVSCQSCNLSKGSKLLSGWRPKNTNQLILL